MEYIIGALIMGLICGFICSAIASSRNMNGGFWWGFWLGIIGIIIVAVRPNEQQKYQTSYATSSYSSGNSIDNYYDKERHEREIIALGGWRCNNCGKANYPYSYACVSCGHKKDEPVPTVQYSLDTPKPEEKGVLSSSADELRKWKQLLDDGIITQEDFEAKKTQLLGL